jgi:hypothetical protein
MPALFEAAPLRGWIAVSVWFIALLLPFFLRISLEVCSKLQLWSACAQTKTEAG